MKKIIPAVLVLVVVVIACEKNKFQTKPQISLVTEGNVIIPQSSDFEVRIKFTDKEGDLQDTLFMIKNRINSRVVNTLRDTISFQVPNFPNSSSGEFVLRLNYQNHLVSAENPPRIPGSNPPLNEADTLNIKFIAKDKAGNTSDTAVLNNVIVLR